MPVPIGGTHRARGVDLAKEVAVRDRRPLLRLPALAALLRQRLTAADLAGQAAPCRNAAAVPRGYT